MDDPATGRRHHKAPPVPPHHHLSRDNTLQDEPQYDADHEEVAIPIEEEENQGPQFTMSFEYEETFLSHKAIIHSDAFKTVLKSCYQWTIFGVYHFVVVATGLCIVLFWAILNSFTIYIQSWCLSPITRYTLVCGQGACLPLFEILNSALGGVNKLVGTLLKGCCKRK